LFLSKDGTLSAPKTDDIMTNQLMTTLHDGVIADRIVDAVQRRGGLLTKIDLRAHRSEWVEPIEINYKEME